MWLQRGGGRLEVSQVARLLATVNKQHVRRRWRRRARAARAARGARIGGARGAQRGVASNDIGEVRVEEGVDLHGV